MGSVPKVSDEQINDIAKQLTHLRGAIVHGGEHQSLSPLDCQTIRFFEVLIYAYISNGNGMAVLSSSLLRTSTGLALLPIFTQSSRKLGFVRM